MPRKREAKTKDRRTKSTIYLTRPQRELIESSGKTVQRFLEDLIDQYEGFDMARWREGHTYLRQMRKMWMGADTVNMLIDHLADPYAVGKKAGEAATITNRGILNLDARAPKDRKRLLSLINRVSGWGVFTEPFTGRISIESPAITSEPFLRGYMEGYLSIRLRTMQVALDRITFQTVKT